MNKPEIRKIYLRILAILACPFILSGCAPKSECTETRAHAHRYVNPKTGVFTYISNFEYLQHDGYVWQEDYITLNKDDIDAFKEKYDLFYGPKNWKYLYSRMASKSDYLEFYYEYTTDDYISQTDEDGNECGYWTTTTHTGWSRDPYDSDNTGRVRLCHNRFYGFRLNYKDGKYKREQSPLADDIRDFIDEYPYFDLDGSKVVGMEFQFKRRDLPSLRPSDFNVFRAPNLANPDLYTENTQVSMSTK